MRTWVLGLLAIGGVATAVVLGTGDEEVEEGRLRIAAPAPTGAKAAANRDAAPAPGVFRDAGEAPGVLAAIPDSATRADMEVKKAVRPERRAHRRRPRIRRRNAERPRVDRGATRAATALLGKQVSEIERRLRRQGILPGDVPGVDQLIAKARRQIKRSSAGADRHEAKATIDRLSEEASGVSIDRAFVERKISRLKRELKRSRQRARFSGEIDAILRQLLNSRFAEANGRINRILEQL
jgi:hypothetical protein